MPAALTKAQPKLDAAADEPGEPSGGKKTFNDHGVSLRCVVRFQNRDMQNFERQNRLQPNEIGRKQLSY